MRYNLRRTLFAVSLAGAFLLPLGQAFSAPQAAATPKSAIRLSGGGKCFDATGRCMHGIFLGYWQQKGGLAQFGYPITD